MIKALIKYFKNFYNKEIDYEIEFEFSIYDILFLILILFIVWKIFVKQKYCSGKEALHTTAVAVAQPPFFKNKIVNYKKTTSFKLI